MEDSAESTPPEDEKPRWRRVLKFIGLLQVAFVLPIALLARWLPTKRGGDMDMAPHVIEDPTYLESVLVNVVALNLFLFVIGVIFYVGVKVLEARDAGT